MDFGERDNSLFDNADLAGLAVGPEPSDAAANDMRKQINEFLGMDMGEANNRMSNRPVSTMLDLQTSAEVSSGLVDMQSNLKVGPTKAV